MEIHPTALRERRRTSRGRAHSPTRERILRTVESRIEPMSTAEIVDATGLHENTVRGHLDALLADGHLLREQTRGEGRGRPAFRWAVSAWHGEESAHAELAAVLAEALAQGGDPVAATREAGARWGARLAAAYGDAPSAERRDAAAVWARVLEVARRQGFAPDPEPETTIAADGASGPAGTRVLLRDCPLLAAVRGGGERIVCGAHEGMIEGFARRWNPAAESTLTPFAQPHACALHLRMSA